MISEAQEHLLKATTVQLEVEIEGVDDSLLGSGVVYYLDGKEYSIILTAKHCIFGLNFEFTRAQLKKLTLKYKYYINDRFAELEIPIEQILTDESEKDIAVIVVANADLKCFLGEEIPVIELSSQYRFEEYNSNGYPNAFAHKNAYHIIHSSYETDQSTYFETRSSVSLSPGTGDNAIEAIQGYSGAGVYIRNLNYLTGIVIELKAASGQFDILNCLKLDYLNELLKGNPFGISELQYKDIPSFGGLGKDQKLQIINQSLNESTYALQHNINFETKEIPFEINAHISLPPIGKKFSRRTRQVNELIEVLNNKSWLHFHGSIGYGKTQFVNLLTREYGGNAIWIRLEKQINVINAIKKTISRVLNVSIDSLNWFMDVKSKITAPLVLILDDLPKLPKTSNAIHFFVELLELSSELGIKIISTSNHKLDTQIKEYLNEAQLEEILIPPLDLEEVSEILSLYEASNEAIERYSKLILYKTKGHPFFINEIISFLRSKEWKTGESDLEKIFNYEFSLDFIQSIQDNLTESVPDQDARNLLYRLGQITGSFTMEEIGMVANIKPQIQEPLEKLNQIKDLWIQQDSESTYIVSPLLNLLKSINLSQELVLDIKYSLGRYLLSKTNLGQYDAWKVIDYFIAAKAYNEAGHILIVVLKEFLSQPKYFYESFFILFWYYSEIPDGIEMTIRLYIRILQISIALEESKDEDILYFLGDLEKMVGDASLIGIDTSPAKLMLSLLYGRINVQKANKYFLDGVEEQNRFIVDSPSNSLNKELPPFESIVWVPLFYAKDINSILDCLVTFSKLPQEQQDSAMSIDHSIIPIFKAFTSIYESELSKNIENRNWNEMITGLDKIISLSKKIRLEIVFAYAVRVKSWILIIHLNEVRKAIALVETSIEEMSGDLDVKFILYDAIARGLNDIGQTDRAMSFFQKALDTNVKLEVFWKVDTLNLVSSLLFEENPAMSLNYSEQAFSMSLQYKEINLIMKVKAIGEYAINQWYNGDKIKSIYILEKGYDLLLQSNDESDSWKSALMKYGHTFFYFSSILNNGLPPEKDISGSPYQIPLKQYFLRDITTEGIKELYFPERRYMAIYSILSCFESLPDLAMSQKWAEYLIRECRSKPQYFQFTRIVISPYLILKNEVMAALRNCFYAWETEVDSSNDPLINTAPHPSLARTVSQRVSKESFTSLALASVILVAIFKILIDYLNGENNIKKLLNDITEWSRNEGGDWQPFIDLFSMASNNIDDHEKINEYVNNYSGDHKKIMLMIGYLLSSINAPTKNAFNFHFQLFPELEKLISGFTPGAIPFLVIPFFERFWEKQFAENAHEFMEHDFWYKKSFPRFKNAPLDKRLKYLIQILSHHLNFDLPSKQEDWINEN